eukprot:7778529-Pyramimonas_sp.AAC.1
MCQAIATALMKQIRWRFGDTPSDASVWHIDDDVAHFFQPLDHYMTREMGQDYRRGPTRRGSAPTWLEEAREWAVQHRPRQGPGQDHQLDVF